MQEHTHWKARPTINVKRGEASAAWMAYLAVPILQQMEMFACKDKSHRRGSAAAQSSQVSNSFDCAAVDWL